MADPFLKKALEPGGRRHRHEPDPQHHGTRNHPVGAGRRGRSQGYEAAGGYAPTIGIIGAVIGLIQVMKNLANIDEVGRGIAVAFVATIYGVASANLFFLPAGSKLQVARAGRRQTPRTDAGRRPLHRRRDEPETDSHQTGCLPATRRAG